MRSTRKVIEDHVKRREAGELETDLARNFCEDVLLLTSNSKLHGHDGIRRSAHRLLYELEDAAYEIEALQVEGGLLIWRAHAARRRVECGADSFVVGDGRIAVQTVHYRLLESAAGRKGG